LLNKNPLESFLVLNENFNNLHFDNLSVNIVVNFTIIFIFFALLLDNTFNIFLNYNNVKISKLFLDYFYAIFKNILPNTRSERFFYPSLYLFIYILFTNIAGFCLLELSLTSHAIIAIFLSFFLFFNCVINIFINFNENTYKKFLQKDSGIFLIAPLFLIELISFLVRPFSLGVRLFANILSGHILIHIFFNAFLYAYKSIFWAASIVLLFCLFILGMEIFVAFVQSYIFFILSLIYLKDAVKIHS